MPKTRDYRWKLKLSYAEHREVREAARRRDVYVSELCRTALRRRRAASAAAQLSMFGREQRDGPRLYEVPVRLRKDERAIVDQVGPDEARRMVLREARQ